MTTGEVNLLAEPPKNLRDEQKWILRGTSAVLHAVALLIILLIPTLFSSRPPTREQELAAAHALGDVYIPPDMKSMIRPAPPTVAKPAPIHIDPKVIAKLAPTPATPPPGPKIETPVPPAPATHDDALPPSLPTSPAILEQPKPAPAPPTPKLEQVNPDQPPKGGLILPNFSASRSIQDSIKDAESNAGNGPMGMATQGRMPGGHGGGYGSGAGGNGMGQANAGIRMLTPSEGLDWNSYMARIVASVRRNWYAIMPESALMGDQGIVMLRFKIYQDGTVVAEDPVLERSSGKPPLDRAAMSSIRASSPFEPLPAGYTGREAHDEHGIYAEFRFIYFYNLPITTKF
jgi:periplasmic protein TonB